MATSLWLHGNQTVGEVENGQYLADSLTGGGGFMPMDSTEPTGSGSSMGITTYGAGPNTACAGNSLSPTWVGDVTGTIKGDVKVTFFTTSMPAQVDVRVWPDIIALTCNENYVPAARELTVDIPSGQGKVEVVLPGDPFTAAAKLMVQISPSEGPAGPGTTSVFLGRVNYDSPTSNSGLSFSCIPPRVRRPAQSNDFSVKKRGPVKPAPFCSGGSSRRSTLCCCSSFD